MEYCHLQLIYLFLQALILKLFWSVRDFLFAKHPHGRDAAPLVLLDCTTHQLCYDQVIFQCLTGEGSC